MEFRIEPRLAAPSVGEGDVVVQAPPDVPCDMLVNPLTRLLPVAMVVASAGMMAVYLTSGAGTVRNPMFMFFPVMMIVSLIGNVALGSRGGSRTAEINQDRRDYLRYLESVDAVVTKTVEAQRFSLDWQLPRPDGLWMLVGGRRMWERRPDDSDFGHARVGLGTQCLSTRLVPPELGPADQLDPVTSTELHRLMHTRSTVADLPVAVALRELAAITVHGDMRAARGLLRAVLCQLAVLHNPDHVRIAAVIDPLTACDWDWLKWLPHHQHPHAVDEIGSARMAYDSLATACDAVAGCGATYTVIVVDGGLITRDEKPFQPSGLRGATIVELGVTCDDIATRTRLRLTVSADKLTAQRDVGEKFLARPDTMTTGQALACARRISSFRPAAASPVGAAGVSQTIAWSALMGIADVGLVDPALHWRTRAADHMLRVPIGVSEHGEPLELDIKEAAANGMGPHGLCIGATGSGKSEFLRTLTLGMIVAHPPEALNLVLVDFKGGATFLGLERAPHVAAVITNLADEAHLVARMKDALAGEMNRRQELLRAAGNFANVAEYDRARRRDRGLAPLPVLFIVVDEFSELLSQHPDFTELFIAIGRLGRSLGIHLLLASQRLDEGRLRGLESHLSYRVCLQTFSTSESRAVLGVPDAYHLPSTPGAAYLKTGSDEPVRFQTAYVSGPYEPSARRTCELTATPMPRLFTAAAVGRVICDIGESAGELPGQRPTVLETVLDRLEHRGSPAHQVWLPPLADSPMLDDVLRQVGTRASLAVPIGVVDCPYEQRRDLLVAQLGGSAGNVAVVGGPRSGKSTALRTLIVALAESHTPRDVQVYCLDFGGGVLATLRSLPHVGSVAGRHDGELVRRNVVQLQSLLRAREARRSSDESADHEDTYGDVFLVIDGWATIRQEFDTLEASITALAAQGLSYRIHVVVSASRWAEIRPALKDQIGTRIELRLGDPSESEMDRKRARQLAQSPPGRGITREGREFAIALPGSDDATAVRLRMLHGNCVAPRVDLLPARVNHNLLSARSNPPQPSTRILLGIGENELRSVAVDFAAEAHLVILGEGECGKTSTLRMLCREIARTNTPDSAQLFIADFRRTLLGVVESDHVTGYTPSAVAMTSKLAVLLERLQARMPGPDVSQSQLRSRSWWSGPEIYLVVDDYDLVAGANGTNPLAPLVDFLPYAKDLGLHVVVARRSGGAARAMFDPVLARLRDLGCMGLMMSASPDEGVLMGSARPAKLPPGRGTLITRSQPEQLVQVAWSDPA
ncbi:MAG TPA: type VII secretion protein EccCa [Mycobacterium sp.]|nr:type VII secretion protein EccCa [Mycobacterium sp.]